MESVVAGAAPRELRLSFWGGEYQGKRIASSSTVTLEMGVTKLFFLTADRERGPALLPRRSGYEMDADVVSTGALRILVADLAEVLAAERRDGQ